MRAHLKREDLKIQLAKRTGASTQTVDSILSELTDIIQTCLLTGVEINFPGLGKFTYTEYVPMKNVLVYNRWTREYEKKDETVGYRKPRFAFSALFRKFMQQETRMTYDEVFSDEVEEEKEEKEK